MSGFDSQALAEAGLDAQAAAIVRRASTVGAIAEAFASTATAEELLTVVALEGAASCADQVADAERARCALDSSDEERR